MRLILVILSTAILSGCAGERYTRHEDGWWTESRPHNELRVGAGHVWGYTGWCRPWTGPWGWYPSPYSPWNSCGAIGYGYGGYWGSPWYGPYPYGWYLPPRSIEGPRAGSRARGIAASPALAPVFPRYEELAPQRRRDTGGGERAFSTRGHWPSPPSTSPSYGLGSASGRGSGLSGSARGVSGGFGASPTARSFGSSQAGSGSGPDRGAGSAQRDSLRSREEER